MRVAIYFLPYLSQQKLCLAVITTKGGKLGGYKYAKGRYLSVDLVGPLPPAAEQVPSFVLNVADVHVVAVVFTERDPGAAEDQQVVAV